MTVPHEIISLPHGMTAVIVTHAELKRAEKRTKHDDGQLELDAEPQP